MTDRQKMRWEIYNSLPLGLIKDDLKKLLEDYPDWEGDIKPFNEFGTGKEKASQLKRDRKNIVKDGIRNWPKPYLVNEF